MGNRRGRKRAPAAEGHAAVRCEPPIEQEVLGVDEHPIAWTDTSRQLGIEYLGRDDEAADRQHTPLQLWEQPVGVRIREHQHDSCIDGATIGLDSAPCPTGSPLDGTGRHVLVQRCTCAQSTLHQPPMEGRRLQPTRAFQHEAAVIHRRTDLVGELITGDEPHRLAQLGPVLACHRFQVRHVPRRVRQ